jgi:fumarylacetoacetate (FAA) hydrolase family protein
MLIFTPCIKIAARWPFNHVTVLALIGSVPHPTAMKWLCKRSRPKKAIGEDMIQKTARDSLAADVERSVLAGRVWRPELQGPSIVTLRGDELLDITCRKIPTISDLCALDDPAAWTQTVAGEPIGKIGEIVANSDESERNPQLPWLLAPVDLQAVKASGVTFIASLMERVIEEQAHGSAQAAHKIRAELEQMIGGNLAELKPGSKRAAELKEKLIKSGHWSQYLEVGIGPDAEIFTKCQPLSAVGAGAYIGIHPASVWNNPEPEIALAVSRTGKAVGAMLANDVNLRDFEGRSALLLGKAKDNNASCSLGPFLRLFDDAYTLDDVRQAEIALRVDGADGFVLNGKSSMSKISRDPLELVEAALGGTHQYPDGFLLLLGTMFAPSEDRGEAGQGFTHKVDDLVTISTPRLGALRNRVKHCQDCAPWEFGAAALMRNLAARQLL